MARYVKPLQEEITRLARKEAVKVERPLKKTIATLRGENTALRKRVKELEKISATFQKAVAAEKQAKVVPSENEIKNVNIQPRSITAMRKKHNLSMLKMAALLELNHKSIARWEKGTGKPQADSKKKLLVFKSLSKTEVKKMLAELDAKQPAPAAPAKKKAAPAKKKAVKKAPVKKVAPAKKPVAKKTAAKKTVSKKTAPVKKTTAKKTTRKRTARKPAKK